MGGPSVFHRAVADDPAAARKLEDVVRRSRVRAGTGLASVALARRTEAPLSRFPGDRLVFSLVSMVLMTGTYISLVHLMAPALRTWEGIRWAFGALAVVVAAAVWQLGSLRQLPRYHPDGLPEADSDRPLEELHDFAVSVSSTLRREARTQSLCALAVFGALTFVLVWSGILIAEGHWAFARVLAPAALLMGSFIGHNWAPLGWVKRKRALAKEALQVAAELKAHIRSPERERRSLEEDWDAAQRFLNWSGG
ncbi:MAG: hypothetical protein ACKVPX_15010 [Myxococcaceae bacterium]